MSGCQSDRADNIELQYGLPTGQGFIRYKPLCDERMQKQDSKTACGLPAPMQICIPILQQYMLYAACMNRMQLLTGQ